jgi:hypothetical protein
MIGNSGSIARIALPDSSMEPGFFDAVAARQLSMMGRSSRVLDFVGFSYGFGSLTSVRGQWAIFTNFITPLKHPV